MNQNNKPMTTLEKEAMIARILKNAEKNPEYKKFVEEKLKENQPSKEK